MKTRQCEASNGVRLWAQNSLYFTLKQVLSSLR